MIGSRPFDGGPFGTGATAGGVGGGVALQAWTQLLAVTEAGGAPVDPTPLGDTGTSFTGGLFRVVATSTIVQVDGYREALCRWTYPVLTLIPTFDPADHVLELAADFRASGGGQFPLGANDGLGVFFGVGDRGTADIANLNACVGRMHRGGISNYTGGHMFASIGSGNSLAGSDPDVALYTAQFGATTGSTWRPAKSVWYRVAATGNVVFDTTATGEAALASVLANWVITTGAYHASTTAATGVDVRWRLFYRLVKRHDTLYPT